MKTTFHLPIVKQAVPPGSLGTGIVGLKRIRFAVVVTQGSSLDKVREQFSCGHCFPLELEAVRDQIKSVKQQIGSFELVYCFILVYYKLRKLKRKHNTP